MSLVISKQETIIDVVKLSILCVSLNIQPKQSRMEHHMISRPDGRDQDDLHTAEYRGSLV